MIGSILPAQRAGPSVSPGYARSTVARTGIYLPKEGRWDAVENHIMDVPNRREVCSVAVHCENLGII